MHDLSLRVRDLERSRAFYAQLPGFVLDQDFPDLGKLRFRIGSTQLRLVLRAARPGGPDELVQVLDALGAPHGGVQRDRAGSASVVAFRDPDGIAREFFEER